MACKLCPELVLVISHPGLCALMSTAQGQYVTGVWSGLLSLLGLAIQICLVGGVIFFVNSSWGLISCHIGGMLSLFFPFPWVCGFYPAWLPIPWSCDHCLDGPFTSASIACMNTSSNWPVSFLICSCRYYSADIVVACMCLVLCMISFPVFVTRIV